ncbi:OB-fold protein [Saccharicrinis sp. GN24d3]|uniref:OB-fold protein n=1 Tax=Saccharicrinis sp. GN24d3 TaxID=3458416 RepID=UPI0040371595
MKKTVILIVIIMTLVGSGVGFYLFNKKVGGLEKVKADYTIAATMLYEVFETQEQEANAKYLNKVILVEGKVEKLEISKEYSSIILTADNSLAGGINCSFNHEIKGVSKGDMISIKGRCQGYLMDVVLNNCNIEYE